MTIDEMMRTKVEPALDDIVEKTLDENAEFYVENDFADDLIEGVIARQRRELEQWKTQKLAEIRAWLERDCQRLQ